MSEVAPVTRSKAQARATYDHRSRSYERLEGRFERHARTTGEQLLAVAPHERILEIGSGPGMSLAAFARAAGPDGHVIGVDLSTNMHSVAAAQLHDQHVARQVSLLLADGAALPIHAQSIDAAFACFTLELFDTPELPVVLDELTRVLRPVGRIVIVSLTTTDPPALMDRAYLLAHKLMPRLADCRPIPLPDLITEAGHTIIDQQRADIVGIPVAVITARTPKHR